MAGVDATGFEAKTLLEIQDEMATAIRAAISPALNLTETSLLGQFIGVTASQLAQLWEAAQDLYANEDIDQATEDRLTAMCRNTGTVREAATYSTVLIDATLAAGTYAAGTLVVHVVGDPTLTFANDDTITGTGAMTGLAFSATELGAIRAEANTLTVIANPVVGFSNPTNPAAATVGKDIEADDVLRIRQRTELAAPGSHTVDAIRVDLLAVDGVEFCAVYENDTDATVSSRPPHSIEALVLGGTDQDVLDALLVAKPAGITTYGHSPNAVTGTATNEQGQTINLAFTRPTEVVLYIDVAVTVLSGQYAGTTALEDALLAWGDANLSVGRDVSHGQLTKTIMDVAGVIDCTVEIGLSAGAGTAPATYVIGTREYGAFARARIATTVTTVTGAP